MNDAELKVIEERAAKATSGPWNLPGLPGRYGPNEMTSVPALGETYEEEEVNATFIASARTDVPALCAALRQAWMENERLRELLLERARAAHDFGCAALVSTAYSHTHHNFSDCRHSACVEIRDVLTSPLSSLGGKEQGYKEA